MATSTLTLKHHSLTTELLGVLHHPLCHLAKQHAHESEYQTQNTIEAEEEHGR